MNLVVVASRGDTAAIQALLSSHVIHLNVLDLALVVSAANGHGQAVWCLVQGGASLNAFGRRAITLAVIRDQAEVIEQIHNLGEDFNKPVRLEKKILPLHLCAKMGKTQLARLLIHCGADVNQQDQMLRCPAYFAVSSGEMECLELLITYGAKLYQPQKHLRSVLMAAVHSGNIDVVKYILENTIWDKHVLLIPHNTVMHEAAASGNTELIQYLVSLGFAYDLPNNSGKTPFLYALTCRNEDAAELLMNIGANINYQTDMGDSALHYCVFHRLYRMLTILLERKMDVNIASTAGVTPLSRAAERGNTDIMKILISYGADISCIDRYGRTVLHNAARMGKTESVKLMIELLPSLINAKSHDQRTPFLAAASAGKTQVGIYLLEHGAKLYARDSSGSTAMHLAALHNHVEFLQMLISLKMDILCRNKAHDTPLHYAASQGNEEALRLLLKCGADIMYRNKKGKTALDISHGCTLKLLRNYVEEKE